MKQVNWLKYNKCWRIGYAEQKKKKITASVCLVPTLRIETRSCWPEGSAWLIVAGQAYFWPQTNQYFIIQQQYFKINAGSQCKDQKTESHTPIWLSS